MADTESIKELFLRRLQKVLSIVSLATVVLLLLQVTTGIAGPEWFRLYLFPVLLSAAVGYLTNYIAIEMLFKPYERREFHWIRLATFGLWRQGMVPANKDKIGWVLGEEIPQRLLNPEAISAELCETAADFTSNPAFIERIRKSVQVLLNHHKERIAAFLVPQIQSSLKEALRENFTAANLQLFWDRVLARWLDRPENRQLLSAGIVSGLKAKSPELCELLRRTMHDGVRDYVNTRLPFLPRSGEFAAGFVAYLDWDDIRRQIERKLEDPSLQELIGSELAHQSERFRAWIASPESEPQIEGFLNGTRVKLEHFLRDYLQRAIPATADQILNSEALWDWVKNELLPQVQQHLNYWLRNNGKRLVIEKLDLSRRIENSIREQDVREFHAMINAVAAEHLGAIQVLGYVLGFVIGLFQVVAGFR